MRLTLKRIVQALLVTVLLSLCSLALLRLASSPVVVVASSDGAFWPMTGASPAPDGWPRSGRDGDHSEYSDPSATATAKPHATLDDVFISVKTTKNFHATRLDVIIKTWFTLAREQVHLFTFYLLFISSITSI